MEVTARLANTKPAPLAEWFQRALTATSLVAVFAEDSDPQVADPG